MKQMVSFCAASFFGIALYAASSKIAIADNNTDFTLRSVEIVGDSYCADVRLENISIDSFQLNVFGSFVISDDDGSRPSFSIMTTGSKNPKFPVNERLQRGDIVAGWLCWTLPNEDWRPTRLVIRDISGTNIVSYNVSE